MSTALTYIWYIFSKLINWFFNDALIDNNVSLGWVSVVIFIFGLLIKSLLNLPRSAPTYSGHYETITTGNSFRDKRTGNFTTTSRTTRRRL